MSLILVGCAEKFKTVDNPESKADKDKVDLFVERTSDNFEKARIAYNAVDYDTSIRIRRENLKISEEMFGSEGRGVGSSSYFIGEILAAQGKSNDAIPYLKRAVKVMNIRFGENHAYTKLAKEKLKETVNSTNK